MDVFSLSPSILQRADGRGVGSGVFVVTGPAESSSVKDEEAFFILNISSSTYDKSPASFGFRSPAFSSVSFLADRCPSLLFCFIASKITFFLIPCIFYLVSPKCRISELGVLA